MEAQELNELLVKNPVLLGIFTATIGAFIGASFTLINTLMSNLFQERREKKQVIRDVLQQRYKDCICELAWFSQLGKCCPVITTELKEKTELLIINFDFLSIYYLSNYDFKNLISLKEVLVDLAEKPCYSPCDSEEENLLDVNTSDVKEIRKVSRALTSKLIELASKDSRLS